MRDQAALMELCVRRVAYQNCMSPVREPRAEVYRDLHETILAA